MEISGTRTLDERLDSTAEAWKPGPGDKLTGVIVDVDSRTTEFGTYPILTVVADDGREVAVHAFHTVLKNELAKRAPRIGERIGLKYLGKSEKGYEAYRVVWSDLVPPDWAAIGVQAEAEAVLESVDVDEPAETTDTTTHEEGAAVASPADDDIPF